MLAPAAEAAPITLHYDVTFTELCYHQTTGCSDVNLGGFVLTLTADNVVVNTSSTGSTATLVDPRLSIDTTSIGFFTNPYPAALGVMAFYEGRVYERDNGAEQWSGGLVRDHFNTSGGPGYGTYVVSQLLTEESPKTPGDGSVVPLTSGDIFDLLTLPDFLFTYSVSAWTWACSPYNCPRDIDPRSFEATGVATYRDLTAAPVPEPATLSLLGLGLAAAAAHRARKR